VFTATPVARPTFSDKSFIVKWFASCQLLAFALRSPAAGGSDRCSTL
jgi:hypothetical protein